MKTKVYSQPFIHKKWLLVKAPLFDRLKFRLSFGLLGRLEFVAFEEKEMVTYFTGYNEYHNGKLFANKPLTPNHISCRCKVVKL